MIPNAAAVIAPMMCCNKNTERATVNTV